MPVERRAVRATVVGSVLAGLLMTSGCSVEADAPQSGFTDAVGSPEPPATGTAIPDSTPITRAEFAASVERLDERMRRQMTGVTWQPQCPVSLDDLRLLTMSYVDFRGEPQTGQMVVNRRVAGDVVEVFGRLFRHGFPVQQMRLVDEYGGSDMRSITANNTSAFNCRLIPGSTTWAEHAYGNAVDINPVQNPYWRPDGYVEPTRGRRFIDRTQRYPGMIRPRGVVVRAFDRIGWGWGGRWNSLKDWQHFSVNGT